MDLDQTDLRILSYLQRDGRARNAALAAAVNLSPSACLARVKRLESAGCIRGYTAQIDLDCIGTNVMVFAFIKLGDQGKEHQAKCEARMNALAEVVEVQTVSGEYDYIARFICRDIARYHELTEALLGDASLGIRSIDSRFVLRTPKILRGPDVTLLASFP